MKPLQCELNYYHLFDMFNRNNLEALLISSIRFLPSIGRLILHDQSDLILYQSDFLHSFEILLKYSATCLNRTLNKYESCIKPSLNKVQMLKKNLDINLTCILQTQKFIQSRFGLDRFRCNRFIAIVLFVLEFDLLSERLPC